MSSHRKNYGTALFGSALIVTSLLVHGLKPAPNAGHPTPSSLSEDAVCNTASDGRPTGVGCPDAATPMAAPVEVDPRAYVRERASRHGWTLQQWKCAARLVHRESRWNVEADNPNSSAYGLFQMLKLPAGTPLRVQVDRFIRYVGSRYNDDPCAALRHSLEKGWY